MNHVPVALGLILCEQIIIDKTSRNVTPISCFSARWLNEFPGSISFDVVAWLADGLGEMSVELIVLNGDTMERIFGLEGQIKFDNPLTYKRFFAHVRDCPIRSAGSMW